MNLLQPSVNAVTKLRYQKLMLVLSFALFSLVAIAQPVINSFAPASGPIGSTVTITGTGFNATTANNIVFFGATRATVSAATATNITLTVPLGASYNNFSVTNTGTNLTGLSRQPFNVTFPGTYKYSSSVSFGALGAISFTASGDLDNDGKTDLVTSFSSTISVFRNNSLIGAPNFGTPTDYNTASIIKSVVISDLDGDGKPDLAVPNVNATVTIFKNTSTPGVISFAPPISFTTSGTSPGKVTDIDGDGKQDIVVLGTSDKIISVLRNTSTPGLINFAPKVDFNTIAQPQYVVASDFDNDGKPDLGITNVDGSFSFFRNLSALGSVSFAPNIDIITGSNYPPEVADMDADGKTDLIVRNYNDGYISIFRNNSVSGTIAFNPKIDVPSFQPIDLRIADIDGDGKVDLISKRYDNGIVSIYPNSSTLGNISFIAKRDFQSNIPSASFLHLVDADVDGRPDVLVIGNNIIFTFLQGINISGFAPVSGPVGTNITITGSGFNSIAAQNVVLFGAAKGTVTATSPGSITVTVPGGATYEDISVTNLSSNLAAYSARPFNTTFPGYIAFRYSGDIGMGPGLQAATIVDLDQDGKSDIAGAISSSTAVVVGRNITTGSFFTSANPVGFVIGSNNANNILGGDVNGDGKPDIMAGNGATYFGLLRNSSTIGSINFSPKLDLSSPNPITKMDVGDIDGDGKPDISFAGGGDYLSLLRNTSSGTSTSFVNLSNYYIGPFSSYGVKIKDLNGDNKPEIIFPNYSNNTLYVIKNTSIPGSFSFDVKVDAPTGLNPRDVGVGDIDGDGKPDVIVSNYTGNTVSILRNISNIGATITFAAKVDFATGSSPRAISLADIDGDGKIDIAIANYTTINNVSILRNVSTPGNVSFEPMVNFTIGLNSSLSSISIGDLNLDGKPDIAVTQYNSNVAVLEQVIPPIITSFAPTSGITGSHIIITGLNFTGTTGVKFGPPSGGRIDASSFTVNSPTEIDAVVGNGNSGSVEVTTGGGVASRAGFAYTGITQFSPTSATFGETVTITGENLLGASAVSFGGVAASSFIVVNATTITAVVSYGLSGTVSVMTPLGLVSKTGFTYIVPPPTISGFTPTSGGYGDIVTITGNQFNGATIVRFQLINASSFTIINNNTIQAVVGSGATGNVNLTTAGGTASLAGFTYLPPTISGFTPTSAANRDIVTITGNRLNGATSVRFGNINAYSFTVINSNTIQAVVGPCASGNVTVITPGGTANLAGFTYTPTPPTITTFTPAVVCAAGTVLTIRGLNFTGATAVLLNGVSSAFTFVSDTVITLTTSAVNNSGFITVTNPSGSVVSGSSLIMSSVPSFLPNPSPFQLCSGSPRQLNINVPGTFTYVCSNGQSGNAITIAAPGSYTLTATDQYGCSKSSTFNVTNYTGCGGYLEIESAPVFNYFDTLRVKIKIKGGVDIFSTFAYLNFNAAHLKYVGHIPGNYLGNNVFVQDPVVTGGQIDFGMSHITGDPGTYGDGIIWEFIFVLADQIPNIAAFNATRPEFFTTNLNLSNLSIYNVSGTQPPSFPAISMLNKPVGCRYYVPVWPGDLNFDKKVNVADILPIGYFYLSTGAVRPNASLAWMAQPSALWGFDKTNKTRSAYKTFADGTPDGIINLADQTSIGFNLNRSHLRASAPPEEYRDPIINNVANIPTLNVAMPDDIVPAASLPKNEVVTLSLGSAADPLNNVYGIAFDIFFNPAAVNTNAITANYAGSIFGTLGTNFTKIEDRSGLAQGRFSIGITRYNTTGINATGGNIMTVTLPLLATAPQGMFKVTAIPVGCNDPAGNDLVVGAGADSLIINTGLPCANNYWQGTVSTAWEDPANWSCGSVPGINSAVFISTANPYNPEVRSMAVCKSLNVSAGRVVTVITGFKINILGP